VERARPEALGQPASFVEGQIAAIAAVNDLTLASRDIKHFRAYRGLRTENWWPD
jgi:tRNA(fMet)-specific endonuclease VapC